MDFIVTQSINGKEVSKEELHEITIKSRVLADVVNRVKNQQREPADLTIQTLYN
jgi:hypothetical protein